MQTILGANGTIGLILARELTSYTDKIRLVSRNPKKVNETDELFPADLSDPSTVDKAIEGSEVVYLVVGFEYKAAVWQEKWPRLMRATIDACKKHHSKLVFFDNVYMYDVSAIQHMTEESPINPSSKKGAVRKQIAEMILNEVNSGNLTALIARSADFYGPFNVNNMIYQMVYKNIAQGKKPGWIYSADYKHSFTFTPDAAKATAILGNTPDAYNQVWHLPTDTNQISVRELIGIFSKEMKSDKPISLMPIWLIRILSMFIPFMKEIREMMYQYNRDYFFDSSKFDKRFDFKTTNYAEGVKQTILLTKT